MATRKEADALNAIATLMDGTQWDADTLEAIAEVLEEAGYTLRNYEGED